MNLLTALLLIGSLLTVMAGHLLMLLAAFRQNFLWGLSCLMLPFAEIFFIIRHWDAARRGFLTATLGGFFFMGAVFVLPNRGECLDGEWRKAFASPSQAPSSGEIEELTSQINAKRDGIGQQEAELDRSTVMLATQYNEIVAKRQTLQTNDPEAVNRFNEEAAAYHELNRQVQAMKQGIEAARLELGDLLNQRSKLQAAAAPKTPPAGVSKSVVIYTTPSCGYCVKAKQYLAQKGVAYQEINVESSDSARAEFQQLGGKGVPLILVGAKRIEGFDRAALDEALQ